MDLMDAAAWTAQVLGGLAVLMAGAAWFLRYSNRRLGERIGEEIRAATYPISPKANGGLSLADVARRTESIAEEVSEVKGKVDLLVDLYMKESK